MTEFTEPQKDALATATVMAQQGTGFIIDADRVADRMTCDGLVGSSPAT
jgi:hypothetical protein